MPSIAAVPTMTTVASVGATSMVTDVGMSAAVAIVTSAATMETCCRATAESASTAAVKSSSATMTAMLGKSSVWQPAKRTNANDCEKNSQESRFHHFRTRARDLSSKDTGGSPMRNTVTLDRDMGSQLIAPRTQSDCLFVGDGIAGTA